MAKKRTSKKCPSFDYFFEPVLKALDMLGGSGSNEEIYKKVLVITNLPDDVVEEMHTFTMSEVEYRLMWARTYLKNFGAVENSKQGVWALTSKGAKMLKSGKIDTKEIKKFTNDKHGTEKPESEDVPAAEKKGWREQVADIGKPVIHNDYQIIRTFLETLYINGRLQLPLKGILLVGY